MTESVILDVLGVNNESHLLWKVTYILHPDSWEAPRQVSVTS